MKRFAEANVCAIGLAEAFAVENACDLIVVRDLLGRNAIAISGTETPQLRQLRETLLTECAPFIAHDPIILLDEMFASDLITDSPELRHAPVSLSPSRRVSILEREVVGSDWLAPRNSREARTRRVTLYGFKGGVGRSTATYALAHHLANQGLVVLVVDLDLESPGVSTMFAPDPDQLPEHGIVDHLVEYGVGNADGLELTARASRRANFAGNGEVWFSSAGGRTSTTSQYLDKLSRAYIGLPPDPTENREMTTLGGRLEAAVSACEAEVALKSRPVDVVLLDSRSGIHDIAAVAITQLSTVSLLFATDNPQTWQGYRQLFDRWSTLLEDEQRADLRGRLQMVASLVPQSNSNAYLKRFADHAQECFAATLYDEVSAGDTAAEVFSFSRDDEDAPHFPFPILHSIDLIGVVPGVDSEWETSRAVPVAYGEFLDCATRLIDPEGMIHD